MLNPQALAAILDETVEALADQIQNIFSLSSTTLDTTTNPATETYNGDSNVQFIGTPSGQKLQANLPESIVFGSGGTGVLGAPNQLISYITGGAGTAARPTVVAGSHPR